MWQSVQKQNVVLIGTFPPNKCGIASFTYDLYNSLKGSLPEPMDVKICVLDKLQNASSYRYPVTMVMDKTAKNSYADIAQQLNEDRSVKLVCIEHEFGLFSGEMGEDIIKFLTYLQKPFIIRFHTVLPKPDPKMFSIVSMICLLSKKVIVMTKNSEQLLHEDYFINPKKITIIPHGTHAVAPKAAQQHRALYKLANKKVLTTFGLLSPNKGIEKGILAMKKISAAFPDALYLVLGQTHPNLIAEEGEKYREHLQKVIDDNGLQNNVKLINDYFPTKKLMEYLALTDIYLFTSLDPHQAVSGTFLYAMSAGCPIISNSFVLAKEMLDDKTGIILKTNEVEELSDSVIKILQNPLLQKQMSKNILAKSAHSLWENVGNMHAILFSELLDIPTAIVAPKPTYNISELKYYNVHISAHVS